MVISNGKPCVGVVLVMLLEDIIASKIKERKQIPKFFMNFNLDGIY